jgi:hypothetical protein
MLNTRENIRNFHFDAIIILAIVFFGLLFYNNSFRNTNELERKPESTYIAVSDNNSISRSMYKVAGLSEDMDIK